MIEVIKISSGNDVDINRIAHREDIKMIAMYSAKNTITNNTDLYSVLNPLTSSLSPSAKSKGDRFASAKILTANISITLIIHIETDNCFS